MVNKKKITLTIDPSTYEEFMQYCKERGMKVSSKIELLIKKELEN